MRKQTNRKHSEKDNFMNSIDGLVRKNFMITEKQEKWLLDKRYKTGKSYSEIVRDLIDKECSNS